VAQESRVLVHKKKKKKKKKIHSIRGALENQGHNDPTALCQKANKQTKQEQKSRQAASYPTRNQVAPKMRVRAPPQLSPALPVPRRAPSIFFIIMIF
jgi:hypothetical protein